MVEMDQPTRAISARGGNSWLPTLTILFDIFLLGLVVLAPSWALQTTHLDPTLPFSMLVWVAGIGLIVGTALALSDTPGEVAHPLAVLGGFAGIVYAVARILPRVPSEATLPERIDEIVVEVGAWLRVAVGGGQATNNLLFLFVLALFAWTIGYFSAWAVVRERSAWWPVTVGATTLTLIVATYPNLYGYMVVQLVASMLLVGRVNQRSREAAWSTRGLRRVGSLSGRAFRASLLLAVVLVLLTWVAPTALASKALSQRIGRADRPWETAQTEFNRLFGGLQAEDQASLSGFSRLLSLHGTFHLADTPVLQISSSKQEYWRVVLYDQYTNHGWLSTDPVDQQSLPAGAGVLNLPDARRVDLAQQVTVLALRGSYVVGASQPVAYDRPVFAQAYPDGPGAPIDLIAAMSIAPLGVGTHYAVVSKVSEASASDLRSANRVYPPGIRRRYLSLPTVPSRVRQLADQTTAQESNPYDKAVAVETYLRTLPYTLDLPAPPAGRDGVDYFLFDAKTGYCDYFASAMAVMLRSVGVPARVVSGYAPGSIQSDGSFLIKDSDSHTWTEAYFPPYGWIPFEPSGSWPRIARGPGDKASGTPTVQPSPPAAPPQSQSEARLTPTVTPSPTPDSKAPTGKTPPPPPGLDLNQFVPIFYSLLALSLILLFAWWLWQKDLFGLPPSVVAYVKMTRLASILGFGFRTGETPTEYATALSATLPEARGQPTQIAEDYSRYRFGLQTPPGGDRPLQLWRVVRNTLLRRIGRLRRD